MFTNFVKVLFLLCFIALSATVKAQEIRGFPIVHVAPEETSCEDDPTLDPNEDAFLPIEEAFLLSEEYSLSSEEDILVQESISSDNDNTQHQVSYTRLTQSAFVCPPGYHYISYNDFVSNLDQVCPDLDEWSISRIQGGGSVDGSGYNCRHRVNDPRSTAQAVCVKTTILDEKVMTASA